MPKVTRGVATLVTASIGVVALLTTLPTWITGTTPTATGDIPVSAPGTAASPAAASMALVILAAGLVLGLAGRVMRVLALVAVIVGSIAAGVTIIGFLSNPDPVAASAAAEVTSVRAINSPVDVSFWPYLTLSVFAVGIGVTGWVATHIDTWGKVGRKYETPHRGDAVSDTSTSTDSQAQARQQAMDDWDAISRGEDPT